VIFCQDLAAKRLEARALFQLIIHGATVEAIRELIAIPSETEQWLRAYASEHPEERQAIERVIELRELAGRELEGLNTSSCRAPSPPLCAP
jgi:hypothetical protein